MHTSANGNHQHMIGVRHLLQFLLQVAVQHMLLTRVYKDWSCLNRQQLGRFILPPPIGRAKMLTDAFLAHYADELANVATRKVRTLLIRAMFRRRAKPA